jgi:hypothetical protein
LSRGAPFEGAILPGFFLPRCNNAPLADQIVDHFDLDLLDLEQMLPLMADPASDRAPPAGSGSS